MSRLAPRHIDLKAISSGRAEGFRFAPKADMPVRSPDSVDAVALADRLGHGAAAYVSTHPNGPSVALKAGVGDHTPERFADHEPSRNAKPRVRFRARISRSLGYGQPADFINILMHREK